MGCALGHCFQAGAALPREGPARYAQLDFFEYRACKSTLRASMRPLQRFWVRVLSSAYGPQTGKTLAPGSRAGKTQAAWAGCRVLAAYFDVC